MVVRRQIGVSVPNHIKLSIYKIASIEGKSVSKLCAEAVTMHVNKWVAALNDNPIKSVKWREKK